MHIILNSSHGFHLFAIPPKMIQKYSSLELQGKGLFALVPMVALLLTIEAAALPVFADLSGLEETYEKSIIVPQLEGIQCVTQR